MTIVALAVADLLVLFLSDSRSAACIHRHQMLNTGPERRQAPHKMDQLGLGNAHFEPQKRLFWPWSIQDRKRLAAMVGSGRLLLDCHDVVYLQQGILDGEFAQPRA